MSIYCNTWTVAFDFPTQNNGDKSTRGHQAPSNHSTGWYSVCSGASHLITCTTTKQHVSHSCWSPYKNEWRLQWCLWCEDALQFLWYSWANSSDAAVLVYENRQPLVRHWPPQTVNKQGFPFIRHCMLSFCPFSSAIPHITQPDTNRQWVSTTYTM